LDIVQLFVERGADIHADNGGGMTPIRLAAMFGRKDVVNYLKSQGAKLSPLGKLIGLPGYMLSSLFPAKSA
ncbi:MAG: ankyrin repeat domain-containing protein, partial [Puniceicoccales bacterium]